MTLNNKIAQFYDDSTPLWLNTWGEQMHHGYYGPHGQRKVDHRQAQLDMIDALLEWGLAPEKIDRMLDAGCGVGGSSRYLAHKHPEAKGLAVTLSPIQAEEGRGYNREAGMAERLEIRAQDVYTLDPNQDGQFDFIWSMESAEHMEDKEGLFKLFHRLLKPGGMVLMATWCHRPEPPRLGLTEHKTLRQICELYHLPPMVSPPELAEAAKRAGLTDIRTDDWSRAVYPFWGAVIQSGLDPRNWPGLLKAGIGTVRGAWAMRYMKKGFDIGALSYAVLVAKKR